MKKFMGIVISVMFLGLVSCANDAGNQNMNMLMLAAGNSRLVKVSVGNSSAKIDAPFWMSIAHADGLSINRTAEYDANGYVTRVNTNYESGLDNYYTNYQYDDQNRVIYRDNYDAFNVWIGKDVYTYVDNVSEVKVYNGNGLLETRTFTFNANETTCVYKVEGGSTYTYHWQYENKVLKHFLDSNGSVIDFNDVGNGITIASCTSWADGHYFKMTYAGDKLMKWEVVQGNGIISAFVDIVYTYEAGNNLNIDWYNPLAPVKPHENPVAQIY